MSAQFGANGFPQRFYGQDQVQQRFEVVRLRESNASLHASRFEILSLDHAGNVRAPGAFCNAVDLLRAALPPSHFSPAAATTHPPINVASPAFHRLGPFQAHGWRLGYLR